MSKRYSRDDPYRNPRDANGECVICEDGITWRHYANDDESYYICASKDRGCWEKFKLASPFPWHFNSETGNWDIYRDGKWIDTGWYLTEGF